MRALTSWPSGDLTLRVPPFLCWTPPCWSEGAGCSGPPRDRRPPARPGGARRLPLLRLTGWKGWLLLIPLAALVVAPAVLPGRLVGQWFGPIAPPPGPGTAPLTLDLSRVPPVLSAILGLLALWVLVQRLRGRSGSPAPAGLVGSPLLVQAGTRAWRGAGVRAPPRPGGSGTAWGRLQGGADRVMGALRPFEERHYAPPP